MKTIKFRGKTLAQKPLWLYGNLVQYGRLKFIVNVDENDHFNHEQVISETVGQFTGLFDHYGKEIYEGDILKFYSDEEGFIEVRFVRGVFAFLWKGNLDDELPINAPTQEWAQVIGNIHDNPELLKGGALP